MNPYEALKWAGVSEREVISTHALKIVREKMGRPNFDDVRIAVHALLEPASIKLRQWITEDQPNLAQEISKFITSLKEQQEGIFKITPTLFCAQYVARFGSSIDKVALEYLEENTFMAKAAAAGYFDIAEGFITTGGAIEVAHEYYPRVIILEGFFDIDIRERVQRVVQLLGEDENGFSIIDHEIDEYKTGRAMIKSYQIPEFLIAGAELFRDLYHEVYPEVLQYDTIFS